MNQDRTYMTLKTYIIDIIENFSVAHNNEASGMRQLDFDIGIDTDFDATTVIVSPDSSNRIKFTLEVKRA